MWGENQIIRMSGERRKKSKERCAWTWEGKRERGELINWEAGQEIKDWKMVQEEARVSASIPVLLVIGKRGKKGAGSS